VGDVIVVVDRDTNQTVWEWNSFDYLSQLDYDSTQYQTTSGQFGWTHGNSAIYNAADNSVYLSLRYLSRIVRIDYATRDIVYNLGFALPSPDLEFGDNLFSWQHSPELQANGNVLLFDNGNRRDHIDQSATTGVSKAVELALTGDPPNGAAISWEWTLPAYNPSKGDADRLENGNTLVTAANDLTLHEVDSAGVEVWRLEIDLGSEPFLTYRSERVDSIILDLPGDSDGDGLADFVDNCPDHANVDQIDDNGDGFGDVCAAALGLPLPEPERLALLLTGAAGLALIGRLRSRR
jgi:hypothetical protein